MEVCERLCVRVGMWLQVVTVLRQNRTLLDGEGESLLEAVKVKEINSEKRNGSEGLNSRCPGIALYDG